MTEERVQKILARAGYGSRRASEELITAGRVKINGKVAVLGSKADPEHDTITIDNQPIAHEQPPVYIAVNKPTGVLSEVSPEETRQTVRDLVPVPGHMFIVGRLDMESEGLILLTNDGELSNRLTHPRYGHEKEYRVLVGTRPDDRQYEAWRHGIVLEDGYRTLPAQVRLEGLAGKGAWLRVILREGRKRQIREMGKLTGLPVLRIQRIRIGSLLLGELKPGEWRALHPEEVRALRVNKTYRETGRDREAPRPPRRAPSREPRREGTRSPRGESARTPGSAPRRPGTTSRTPGSAPRRPGSTTRTPGSTSRGPSSTSRTPGSNQRTPGSRTRTQDSTSRTPGSAPRSGPRRDPRKKP